MPYKDPARRRAYLKKKRKDPKYRAKLNAYFREYVMTWRKKHLERLRKYQREWRRKYREKHPRKSRAYNREWRRKNPAKVRAMYRRWYALHGKRWRELNKAKRRRQQRKYYRKERRLRIDQQRARRRRHYWKNRDGINERRRMLWAKNPDLFRSRERNRYRRHRVSRVLTQRNTQARRAGAKGEITPKQWLRLLRQHNFRCFYCNTVLTAKTRTLDHKIPLSRGGTNTINNVVPACRPCNNRKLRMTTEEFIARLKKDKKSQ
jgi:5-methylcytosine-specific restriction endonuclease McrA